MQSKSHLPAVSNIKASLNEFCNDTTVITWNFFSVMSHECRGVKVKAQNNEDDAPDAKNTTFTL